MTWEDDAVWVLLKKEKWFILKWWNVVNILWTLIVPAHSRLLMPASLPDIRREYYNNVSLKPVRSSQIKHKHDIKSKSHFLVELPFMSSCRCRPVSRETNGGWAGDLFLLDLTGGMLRVNLFIYCRPSQKSHENCTSIGRNKCSLSL